MMTAEDAAMFDRFHDDARRTMSQARQEAQRLGHAFIGTEHLLLGAIADDHGDAAVILRELGISTTSVREAIESRAPRGTETTRGQLPFTPRSKRVLECALEEAQGFGHDFIGAGHILLGLLRVEDGIAGQMLRERGVPLAATRERARTLLDADRGPSSPRVAIPSYTVEVVDRDGVAIARRESHFPFPAFTCGDRLRLGPSSPAMKVVEIEHVFMSDAGAPREKHLLRLVAEPADDGRSKA